LCNPIIQSPIHGAHCQKIYNLTVRAVETAMNFFYICHRHVYV
jgi:hypothetical protein